MGVYDHLIYSKQFADSHGPFIKLHFDHTHEISMQITDAHVTITSHIMNINNNNLHWERGNYCGIQITAPDATF